MDGGLYTFEGSTRAILVPDESVHVEGPGQTERKTNEDATRGYTAVYN